MKTIAFFNNKGGVGKTSLVYHLAWMYADRGLRVLVADLDPQANLTAMFIDDDRLIDLWEGKPGNTVVDSLKPLVERTGDIREPHVEMVGGQGIGLVPGNLALSRFEDLLSQNWPECLSGVVAPFRVMSAFHRIVMMAVHRIQADIALIDVGPNLGAINRAALIAADQVVLPLAPDLFSLQGLRNLGPTLRSWRKDWKKRLGEFPAGEDLDVPEGNMLPLGYVVMQHGVRESRPVKAYQRWLNRIPSVYRTAVLDESIDQRDVPAVDADPHRLALLRNYRSLMPLAMDAHKPMFFLKASDGAIGAHAAAVKACYDDFLDLGTQISLKSGFEMN